MAWYHEISALGAGLSCLGRTRPDRCAGLPAGCWSNPPSRASPIGRLMGFVVPGEATTPPPLPPRSPARSHGCRRPRRSRRPPASAPPCHPRGAPSACRSPAPSPSQRGAPDTQANLAAGSLDVRDVALEHRLLRRRDRDMNGSDSVALMPRTRPPVESIPEQRTTLLATHDAANALQGFQERPMEAGRAIPA